MSLANLSHEATVVSKLSSTLIDEGLIISRHANNPHEFHEEVKTDLIREIQL